MFCHCHLFSLLPGPHQQGHGPEYVTSRSVTAIDKGYSGSTWLRMMVRMRFGVWHKSTCIITLKQINVTVLVGSDYKAVYICEYMCKANAAKTSSSLPHLAMRNNA
jgi:hypothetical protein